MQEDFPDGFLTLLDPGWSLAASPLPVEPHSSKGRCAGCKISLKIRGGSRGSSRTSPGALEFAGGASGESAPRCFVHPGYFASRQQLAKLQHFDPSARHRKNPSPSRPPRGAVPSPPAAPRQMCLLFTPLPGFWVTNSLTPRSQPSPEGMFEFVLSAGSGPSSPYPTGGGRGSWKLELFHNNSFCCPRLLRFSPSLSPICQRLTAGVADTLRSARPPGICPRLCTGKKNIPNQQHSQHESIILLLGLEEGAAR